MATPLGFDSIGGNEDLGWTGGYLLAIGPFTATDSVTITKLLLYTYSTNSARLTMGVYAHDSGNNLPGALLAHTAGGGPLSGSFSWVSQDLTVPLAITNGTQYWLVFSASGQTALKYATGGAGYSYNSITYSDGVMTDPWPGAAMGADYQVSFYADTSGAPPSATTYAVDAPAGNLTRNTQSGDFTFTPDAAPDGDVTVTPDDNGAGGTWSPSTVVFSDGDDTPQTAKYTAVAPAGPGTPVTLSFDNDGGLTDPADIDKDVDVVFAGNAWHLTAPTTGIVPSAGYEWASPQSGTVG